MNPILSTEEARELLELIKETALHYLNFPNPGQKTIFGAKAIHTKDEFDIHIFRGRIRHGKYSFQTILKRNNVNLLSLDIDDVAEHRNPDGQKISGSHWHIYTEEYNRALAFPAENIDSANFVENSLLYFKKINLIHPPQVHEQSDMNLE